MKIFAILFPLLLLYSFVYSQGAYRDPFRSLIPKIEKPKPPPPKKKENNKEDYIPPPKMNIEGILWGTDMPAAIIDGEVYRVGDTIKGTDAKLHKIEKNNIFIFYKNQLYKMGVE